MSDEKDPVESTPEPGEDGTYVLEDTGESLEDFTYGEASRKESERTASGGEPEGDEVERLRAENGKLRDRYLRVMADFENYRKRSEREKADFFRYALADTVRGLLPVLDNLERALASSVDTGDDFRKGVELIYKQLAESLQKAGLTPIDEPLVPFDPTIHEAVLRVENSDLPTHTVMEVMQKGYFLNERLIRPAMVKVAVGGPEGSDSVQTP